MTLQVCARHQRFPASIPNVLRSGRGKAEFLDDSCLRHTQLAWLRGAESSIWGKVRRLNLTTGVTHSRWGWSRGRWRHFGCPFLCHRVAKAAATLRRYKRCLLKSSPFFV